MVALVLAAVGAFAGEGALESEDGCGSKSRSTAMLVCLLLRCLVVLEVSILPLLVVSGALELSRVTAGVLLALVARRTFPHSPVGSPTGPVARLLWHR